ncbi:PLP-dependent aminotransferase family protein [Acinetobacter colistiniresistens]|uniref:PLP-dependent aminotransferase family protein n=1 Tax=Acinetobacter colistiniresistens TaxID=280145 RepID=A0A558F7R6_9GAMM|nr:PLP-dependent aminotransferase family protein [Acinetobacter colistiniresistens]TVT81647.1 PLP-dependent aminotransferase family protein [Acinetobacter colistiniresistens]
MARSSVSADFPHLVLPAGTIKEALYTVLRDAILDGRLRAGAKLPSSRMLAEMMSISRNSVLAALDRLLDEGYLTTQACSGTYVSPTIPDQVIKVQAHNQINFSIKDQKLDVNPNLAKDLAQWKQQQLARGKQIFHVGVGCVDLFPHQLWGKLLNQAWKKTYHQLGQAHDSQGYLPLRQAVCRYVQSTRGLNCTEQQILIVNGTQQALHLTAYVLLQAQDHVCLDEPGYDAARAIFRSFGANVHPISSDQEGMNIPEIIQQYPYTKLVYTTPSHQFPIGGTLSLSRRLELLDWAEHQQKWIFEDDYNGEFRYGTRAIQALQGLDQQQRVIYSGTFSKMMFPEFRLGFLVIPDALIDLFSLAKNYTDTRSSYLEQVALASFIQDGHYARHVRKIRKACAERQQALISAIQEYLSDILTIQTTDSGIHLVCWLKQNWTEDTFIQYCRDVNLAVQPLSRYCQMPAQQAAVLFGFAAHTPDEIKQNIQTLAERIERG